MIIHGSTPRVPRSPIALDRAAIAAVARQVAQGATAARAATGAPPTPEIRAANTIFGERQRLEQAKYQFSPELQQRAAMHNGKVTARNAKLQKKVDDISRKMEQVRSDPRLSEKARAARLQKLSRQRDKLLAKIKPPVDLTRVTREIDEIMNRTDLSEKQKKQRIQAIKDRFGLSKGEMKSFFTRRLAGLYKGSEKRLAAAQRAQLEPMKHALERAERASGKNSPQAVALRERIERLSAGFQGERSRLGQTAKTLKSMYPSFWEKVGGAFKSIGKALFKVVDFAMPFVKMIPGVGQIAGAVWGGVKALGSIVRGDWKGALGAITEAIPGVGGAFGRVLDFGKRALSGLTGGGGPLGLLKGFAGKWLGGLGGGLSRLTDLGRGILGRANGLLERATGFVDSLAGRAADLGRSLFRDVFALPNRVADFARDTIGGLIRRGADRVLDPARRALDFAADLRRSATSWIARRLPAPLRGLLGG